MARIKLHKRLSTPRHIMIRGRQQLQEHEAVDARERQSLAKAGYLDDDGYLNTARVKDEVDFITGEAMHADEVTEVQDTIRELAESLAFEGAVRDTTDKLENSSAFKVFAIGKVAGTSDGDAKDALSFLR